MQRDALDMTSPSSQSGNSRRAQIRRFAVLVAWVSASIVLVAAVLEIGVRITGAGSLGQQSIIQSDPESIFDLRPSVSRMHRFRSGLDSWDSFPVHISTQSVRDREFGPKESSERRIVMLGDSFTFGSTSEFKDTIGQKLESLFAQTSNTHNVTTVNCGVHGTGPWQQERILERRGFLFEPDVVVHQIFLGNDIRDMLNRSGRTTRAYEPAWELELHRIRMLPLRRFRAEQWLADRSRAYAVLRDAIGRDRITQFLLGGGGVLDPVEQPLLPPNEPRLPTWEVNLNAWYPELEEAFDALVESLEQAHRACARRGVKYLVYCVPLPEEVVDAWYEERIGAAGLADLYEPGKGEQLLQERLEALGIAFVPLRDAMRAHPSPESLYFEFDGHTRPAGNELIAEKLVTTLSVMEIAWGETSTAVY